MDDWASINVIDGSHDAVLEFLFGSHADVAQNGAGELGEETLDQIEPGAVLGRKGELGAALGLGGEPSFARTEPECLPQTELLENEIAVARLASYTGEERIKLIWHLAAMRARKTMECFAVCARPTRRPARRVTTGAPRAPGRLLLTSLGEWWRATIPRLRCSCRLRCLYISVDGGFIGNRFRCVKTQCIGGS